jgi:hypothetical protein
VKGGCTSAVDVEEGARNEEEVGGFERRRSQGRAIGMEYWKWIDERKKNVGLH